MSPPQRRVPLEPIVRHIAARFHIDNWVRSDGTLVDSWDRLWLSEVRPSNRDIARILHRHIGVVQRWSVDGIPVRSAGEVALELGHHETWFWPELYQEESCPN